MRVAFFIGVLIVFCQFSLHAQSQRNGGNNQNQPVKIGHTKTQNEMDTCASLNEIKEMYVQADNYKRRYVIQGLPAYFADRNIVNIPAWVNQILFDALKSGNALLVREAVIAIGTFRIDFGEELLKLYRNSPSLGQ